MSAKQDEPTDLEAMAAAIQQQGEQIRRLAAHLAQFTGAFEHVWKRLDTIDGAQPVPLYMHEHTWRPVKPAVWQNDAGQSWAEGAVEVCECGARRNRIACVGIGEVFPA
jgi:hypothetical protein